MSKVFDDAGIFAFVFTLKVFAMLFPLYSIYTLS